LKARYRGSVLGFFWSLVNPLLLLAVYSFVFGFVFRRPVGAAAGRWLGYPVGGWGALLVPLVIALQLPMLAGLALGLAALNAHFKDVRDLLGNLLTLLFFLAPILYPLAAVPLPALRALVRFNPFTPFTLAWQATLFEGAVPPAAVWLHMAAVALVAWAAGAALFGRLRETLVEAV
jgi:ABC-type polysaccharide/polyol phosphate export permease